MCTCSVSVPDLSHSGPFIPLVLPGPSSLFARAAASFLLPNLTHSDHSAPFWVSHQFLFTLISQQVKELLQAFGALRAFNLVKDTATGVPKVPYC